MIKLELPMELKPSSTISFLESLNHAPNLFYECIIDCSKLRHVEPFSMIQLVAGISDFKNKNKSFKIKSRGPFLQYPSFMGLFYYTGLTEGEFNSDYKLGNPRYTKITKHITQKIFTLANENFHHFCEEIVSISESLAFVLARDSKTEIYSILKYTICEMFRNVLEHSESEYFYYCAQYWPKKDKVEIGIIDLGIGIRNSLNKNPNYQINDDISALNYSLTPGVSASYYESEPNSKWFNAGVGLYMTSRICEDGGSFLLMSGTKGIVKENSKKLIFDCDHRGTGVRLILKPSRIKIIEKNIPQYQKDASEIIAASGGKPTGDAPSTILKIHKKGQNNDW